MNKELPLNSDEHSPSVQILSPHFKKIKAFNNLQNQEKKLYHVISRFLNNSEVIHPLSQLTEFLENYNVEELSWKKCFMILCLFLDHQTIRRFTQQNEFKQQYASYCLSFPYKKSEQEMTKATADEKKSIQLNKKRLYNTIEDQENFDPKKKKSRNDSLNESFFENHHKLFCFYLLNKLENIKNLYNQTFKNISNEAEVSDDAITMEKSFYDLIGLKYTYYTTSFFNNSSLNVKRLILSDKHLCDSIEVFDNVNFWCIQRISKRESISNAINFTINNNDLRSILNLSSEISDEEVINQSNFLLKWLFLPIEDISDSEKIFKSYIKLKEARIKWDYEYNVKDSDGISIKTRNEHFYLAKSNFQKRVIEFVLDRHNEQQNKWYNPFWTLGIDPKKFKINEMSSVKKKLLLFTHPDKILEKKMKEKANEAYIIIRESLDLINKLLKTNKSIIESLPKGPELSYDFNSYFENYVNGQNKIPEILEVNASIIEVNGKKAIRLPPGIRLYAKFSELKTNIKLKIYLTLPFIGSNTLIEKNQLMEYVFYTYLVETNSELGREDIQIKISGDCICFEISDLIFSGYPGITELSYYIGVQVVYHDLSSKIIWKRVKTKLPSEHEIIKGFSKNGIKKYLELYCRTYNERKFVQNMFSAAKLWNIIDNTSRKTELIKVLIALMENSYKISLVHMHNS